jgi:D-alanyl-D-alanine carboxypeptidase
VSDVDTDLPTGRAVDPDRLTARMTRAVAAADRARARRGLPPLQALVRAPGFQFSAGDRGRPFHAASVGKALTATRAFQLAEAGRLDLDAPVTDVLPQDDWRGLFVRDGRDRAAEVTTRHLLAHTSGAADYFEGRVLSGPTFGELLVQEPERRWAPAELLAFSRDHQRPVAEPGRRFSYSDTGYVLLGRVIENAGGAGLGMQLHEGIFAPTGMADSCLLFHTLPGGAASTSAAPAADLGIAPLWIGRDELSRAGSLSCDWGGGGVVTTLDDLDRFWSAWSAGDLIGEESRRRMGDIRSTFRPGIRYGQGLMRLHYEGFSPFLRGLPRPVGHLGVTGAHAFTAPEVGIRIVLNFHSTREMLRSFRVHIQLMQLLTRALRS